MMSGREQETGDQFRASGERPVKAIHDDSSFFY